MNKLKLNNVERKFVCQRIEEEKIDIEEFSTDSSIDCETVEVIWESIKRKIKKIIDYQLICSSEESELYSTLNNSQ